MSWFDRHVRQRLPGSAAVRDGHGFAFGHTATLPVCDEARRGEKRRVDASSGDAEWTCRYTGSAYEWVEAGSGSGSGGLLYNLLLMGG